MFCGGFGESEGAPVCVAADYAAGAEDLDAGIFGDSVKPKEISMLSKNAEEKIVVELEWLRR